MTHEQYLSYESRLKQVMDEESRRVSMEQMKQEIEQKEKEVEQKKRELEQRKRDLEQKEKQIAHQMEQASKEAEQKVKESVASQLLQKGMSTEEVATLTDLPMDRIHHIKCEIE